MVDEGGGVGRKRAEFNLQGGRERKRIEKGPYRESWLWGESVRCEAKDETKTNGNSREIVRRQQQGNRGQTSAPKEKSDNPKSILKWKKG